MYNVGDRFTAPQKNDNVYEITSIFGEGQIEFHITKRKSEDGSWFCHEGYLTQCINEGALIELLPKPTINLPEELFNV